MAIPPIDACDLDPETAAQAAVEGALLGSYEFGKYKTKDREDRRLDLVRILVSAGQTEAARTGAQRGEIIAQGVILARTIAEEPSAFMTPERLMEQAEEVSRAHGLRFTGMHSQDLVEARMDGILSVGKGSIHPPTFTAMELNPDRTDLPCVVLIGKGITFDSGGLSLGSPERMDEMKYDMSGGAVVIGIMEAASRLDLPIHLVGLIPAAENMPSGTAMKPGEIVTISDGTTVEIKSSHAEGRLLLAEALLYANRYEPDAVIDLATLTGTCARTFGRYISGLMGNDEALMERLESASAVTGERIWRLPLDAEYSELNRSHIADLKNCSDSKGGTLTAAAFLKEFVSYPWAHLDIDSVAWNASGRSYYPSVGATGFGVRLITRLLTDWRDAA